MRKRIEARKFGPDYPMQGLTGTNLYDCLFYGPEEALKDAQEIYLENCTFSRGKPLHTVHNFKMFDCKVTSEAQAALWGCEQGKILEADILGSQSLQHSKNITFRDCRILSDEFGRNCEEISLEECNLHGRKLFQGSSGIRFEDVEIHGSDVLQNMDNVQISNCYLNSPNALQNSKNVTIVDSMLKGDLLGWNCENVTLIGCKISGLQPFCHCRNLKLMDCSMEGSELAFEYSDVKASIAGHLLSVKNPLSGQITADTIGVVVMDDETLVSTAKITERM